MPQPLKISLKAINILCFLMLMPLFGSKLNADTNDDEDATFYNTTVENNFRIFFKKYRRYPKSWIELGAKDFCNSAKENLPKPDEGLVWRPTECEMSYQLVYSNREAFKVVALKNGHVVSIFENYKATYLKTPYHNHEPAICPADSAC
jgi:hypothetical protein